MTILLTNGSWGLDNFRQSFWVGIQNSLLEAHTYVANCTLMHNVYSNSEIFQFIVKV